MLLILLFGLLVVAALSVLVRVGVLLWASWPSLSFVVGVFHDVRYVAASVVVPTRTAELLPQQEHSRHFCSYRLPQPDLQVQLLTYEG
jgi:hypothetical protein